MTDEQIQALHAIAADNQGMLQPQSVVETARDPDHPLHDCFDWDDGSAAEKYRLVQARGLIRRLKVMVVLQERETQTITVKAVPHYTSLPTQRGKEGYEATMAVVTDTLKREELILTAMRELLALRRKYQTLAELSEVWAAVDRARAKNQAVSA